MFLLKIKDIGWERKNTEFPFFKDNPRLSNTKWALLVIESVIIVLCSFSLFGGEELSTLILFFSSIIVPLYAFKGHWREIFKKPEINDIWVIIFCVAGDLLLGILLSFLLSYLGLVGADNSWLNYTIWDFLWVFPQLVWEEVLRFIPFIASLYLCYKGSDKRNLSVIIATIISLLVFGFVHITTYGNVFYALIGVGFGSIFLAYSYLRTKNLFVAYIVHVLIDYGIFALEFLDI
ncbi:CPBP family intramembrane glutamic endopeptidase [Methanobrevibacter sp. AbM4]|uniref:CPBP family intramembrane glutamic endopeptidase n=1 Tax=Methanobrevibacter sp. AbM4 TaxID=224719 RepID=UPI0003348447|nr:CPBP family intramembrane glutamic endopeptidase [Methanobrevibacter sp. AbM4]AGN17223.1 CAAX amino terminal protease family protein [Methanobrevibacter sp. AbM4]